MIWVLPAFAADVVVGPAKFAPAYPSPDQATVEIPAFRLDVVPVTEREYAGFVAAHPAWRRDRVPRIKADEGYLSHWAGADGPGPGILPDAPITGVSWFAAKSYCAAVGKRLPTEDEWELAAAASETSRDARKDPAFVQRLLDWYARPTPARHPAVGGPANAWGVRDLHGLVWEWVLDFSGTMVTGDNRDDGDSARFCGTGALSAADVADYAAFMRFAFRSSLRGDYTTRNLGFRCAADLEAR